MITNNIVIRNALVVLSLFMMSQVLNATIVTNGCSFLFPTFHVWITNNIGSDIKVHCGSRDDDLGDHWLVYGQGYHFAFRPSFPGITQFSCAVITNGDRKRFMAYLDKRDYSSCYEMACNCSWTLKADGPCFNGNCIPWDS